MNRPSLKNLVRDYWQTKLREDLTGTWGVAVLFRPFGLVLAWIALGLGVSATALTLLGLALTVLLAIAVAFLPAGAVLPVIALQAAIYQILDHADGPLARATQTQTAAGGFLDFASDIAWRAVVLAAIGHGLDRLEPGAAPSWLAVGLAAGLCATFARLLRSHGQPASPFKATRLGPGGIVFAFLSGLDQLVPFLALIAWSIGWLGPFLWGVLIYHAADALGAWVARYLALRSGLSR
jgi:phosphatidylglycerophosphate synthase